jgi:dihydrolipoamide dehydrogenase
MAQGEMVAELVAGENRSWDKRCIPAVCFTDPEIVTAGLSPEQAEATGIKFVTGFFPFQANGRAMTLGNEAGFIRVLARADNHLLLGIQGVGTGIAELSAGFSLALEMAARLEDVAGTIHAHPTLGESFLESVHVALGTPVHL